MLRAVVIGGAAAAAALLAAQAPKAVLTKEQVLEQQLASTQKPDMAVGRALYEKNCASCHLFGNMGTAVGPDLTTVNSRFKKRDILESILWPSKTISDQYESIIIQTTENQVINALIVREDETRLVVRMADIDRPVAIPLARIKQRRKSDVSLMPEGLADPMSASELNSLVGFLLAGAQ